MSNISKIIYEMGHIVKQTGKKQVMPGDKITDVYNYSELRFYYTIEGIFDGMFFSAVESPFFIGNDYKIYLIVPNDEGENKYHPVDEALNEYLVSYLEWRLNVLRDLSI